MGPSRTKTVKNKHAANSSGIKNSKTAKRTQVDPVVKARKTKEGKKPPVKPGQLAKELQKKRRKKVYSEKDLGIPELNMVTPVGVEKPKGKKKGKVFVDDRVGCACFYGLFPGIPFGLRSRLSRLGVSKKSSLLTMFLFTKHRTA